MGITWKWDKKVGYEKDHAGDIIGNVYIGGNCDFVTLYEPEGTTKYYLADFGADADHIKRCEDSVQKRLGHRDRVFILDPEKEGAQKLYDILTECGCLVRWDDVSGRN